MSVAKIKTFRNYAEASEFMAGKTSVKIGHNTELINDNAGTIGIKYHATVIVAYKADGTVTFDTGGWDTMTTFGRMHQVSRPLGYAVSRKNWEPILTNHKTGETHKNWRTFSIRPDGSLSV